MPPRSPSKSTSKQKRRSNPRRKLQKARSPASRPLRAHSDPIRKQEWPEKGLERNARGLPSLEILDLMNRTVTAFTGLPLRMARCRTPLDAWIEQTQLLHNIAADCQSVAFRMMTGGLVSLPQPRPRTPASPRRGAGGGCAGSRSGRTASPAARSPRLHCCSVSAWRRWFRARRRPELRSVAQLRRASTLRSIFGADGRVRRWPIHMMPSKRTRRMTGSGTNA